MIGRLKRRAEFLQVAAANKKWVAPGLILQVCRHSRSETGNATLQGGADLLHPAQNQADQIRAGSSQAELAPQTERPMRIGFTASRKVGNAVARNRAKRRLRAAADQIVSVHGAPGHDIVLIARQSTITRDFAALLQDLTTGLKKMGAYQARQQS